MRLRLPEAVARQRLVSYGALFLAEGGFSYSERNVSNPINLQSVNTDSALDTLERPYLPLVVQESAGIPLDPSFAEQKKILDRCHGLFYAGATGAEARRFNRLLIDAGLIKGL